MRNIRLAIEQQRFRTVIAMVLVATLVAFLMAKYQQMTALSEAFVIETNIKQLKKLLLIQSSLVKVQNGKKDFALTNLIKTWLAQSNAYGFYIGADKNRAGLATGQWLYLPRKKTVYYRIKATGYIKNSCKNKDLLEFNIVYKKGKYSLKTNTFIKCKEFGWFTCRRW